MKELKELQRLEDQNRQQQMQVNSKTHRALANSSSIPINANSNRSTEANSNRFNANASNENNLKSQRINTINGSNRSINSQNSVTSSIHPLKADTLNKSSSGTNNESGEREGLTWIHELFQGILVNETKCLNCETVCLNFLNLL
jgi:hypothetical protein